MQRSGGQGMCGLQAELWQKARNLETGRRLVLKLRLGSGLVQSAILGDPSGCPVEACLLF